MLAVVGGFFWGGGVKSFFNLTTMYIYIYIATEIIPNVCDSELFIVGYVCDSTLNFLL